MHHKSAFSLVELSIVLVILGLLVGGVLSGRSLIRAAELRGVMTEFQQWQTAINSFKAKYNALPGDMRNATQFWGQADSGTGGQCSAPATAIGTGKQTCNGNGDGEVTFGWMNSYEGMRFWQHLANAGLIEGIYAGIIGLADCPTGRNECQVAGVNVPASKTGGAWGFCSLNYNMGWQWDWGFGPHISIGRSYNSLCLGGEKNGNYNGGEPDGSFLTPEEAWSIDQKFDDGKAGVGMIRATRRGGCTDATSASGWQDAGYKLTDKAIKCALLFPYAF